VRLDPLRVGLAVGAVVGLWHLGWATLVALGGAKPILGFVLWIHFLQVPVTVEPFDAGRAAILVGLTFALAAVVGAVFAGIWNWLHRRAPA